MSDTFTCPYCKATMPNDAGSYYHRKDCEARDVRKRLDYARAHNADDQTIRRLERELEYALYVGD